MRKKNDPAHEATERLIAKMEKDIAKEYRQASGEVGEKLADYLNRFAKKDETWRRWVEEGKKSAKEYQEWLTGQAFMGKRWEDMKNALSDDLVNAHKRAEKIANGYRAEAYAVNHNYATYLVEKEAKIDTRYTLYNRDSVERMWRDNPKIYGRPGKKVKQLIRDGKLKKWNKKQIQSIMTQGILQGESIPQLTKRLEKVTGGDHNAAIRNARTMMTGVQNAGRMDAYKRANNLGIETQKTWLATLDSRTRHWHRELDGKTLPMDEPFETEYGDIMYPGDPDADGANIYNCRCTLTSSITGFEIDWTDTDLRENSKLGKMSYDEWLEEEESDSNPIDAQEKLSNAMKYSFIKQYREG